MRITIDIEDTSLVKIQQYTGIVKKSPAVRRALDCYVQDAAKKRFLAKVLAGRTDYALTNAELEELGTYDAN